jgi:hypothetical protein
MWRDTFKPSLGTLCGVITVVDHVLGGGLGDWVLTLKVRGLIMAIRMDLNCVTHI